jgi:hypothetical protein
MNEKKMSKRIARAEAHAFALEMIRQGIDGGALWSYNDASQEVLVDELSEICARHQRYADIPGGFENLEKYKREQ